MPLLEQKQAYPLFSLNLCATERSGATSIWARVDAYIASMDRHFLKNYHSIKDLSGFGGVEAFFSVSSSIALRKILGLTFMASPMLL